MEASVAPTFTPAFFEWLSDSFFALYACRRRCLRSVGEALKKVWFGKEVDKQGIDHWDHTLVN